MQWRTETARTLHSRLADVLGDKAAKALGNLGLFTVDDLMHHLPRRYLSGTQTTDLSEVRIGEHVAIVARLAGLERHEDASAHRRPGHDRGRLEAVLTDGGTRITATFFGRFRLLDYWERQLNLGVKGIFVGKVGEFRGQLQVSHPDFVMLDAGGNIVGRASETREAMARQVSRSGLVGIYPASAKLPTWQIGECAEIVLDGLRVLADSLPGSVVEAEALPGLFEALDAIHRPQSEGGVAAGLRRLKFEEALALQLTMAYRRRARADHAAPPIAGRPDGLLAAFDRQLPFALTPGQLQVAADIASDMARPTPMQRLLQGEVGAGKTVVALRAMLAAVDAGHQAVLLAPTEVLAAQHTATIRALMGDLVNGGTLGAPQLATRLVTLTGSMSAIARRHALDAIASGEAGLIVGTHALLYDVKYARLGLVVIDEQHRFGVEQRAVLTDGDPRPHVLVMTATPIPRSVAMTVFGDLETSTLADVPAGRGDVATTVVGLREHPAWLDRAWQRVREEVAAGRQVFIVCPRISAKDEDVLPDEGSPGPSASAVELEAELAAGPLSGLRLGLLHGRLTTPEKDEAMGRFAAGDIDVLVCTTVIEVGIDVPNASMMVVMNADRFGISQLHQLRGRIGRGAHTGVCLLVTGAEAGSRAAERLRAVASTRDGFQLAEFDLAVRREGDVLGADQSGGRSTLRLLRALDDADLIAHAREVAEALVASDPSCEDPRLADLVAGVEQQSDWLERS